MPDPQPLDVAPSLTPVEVETHNLLLKALRERADIKKEEDILARRKADVNVTIALLFMRLGIDKYIGPEGALSLNSGGTLSTLDKDKLIAGLLSAGLSAIDVKAIMAAATETKIKMGSVGFRVRGEGE